MGAQNKDGDEFRDPDINKFEFFCTSCVEPFFREISDEDWENGTFGPIEFCEKCQNIIDNFKKKKQRPKDR